MKQVFRLVLFIGFWAFSVGGFTVLAQYNLTYRDKIVYSQGVNDVWGYVSPGGNEYAIVGTQTGVAVVNVTNPDDIQEVQFISGVNNLWRDVHVWQHHAYVTTESAAQGGLQIIDLSALPAAAPNFITPLGFGFSTAHTIWIDENGIGYLYGATSGLQGNGTFMVDIATNPTSPVFLGKYSNYIHDGYVRNDTLWSAEIYNGVFRVVNVANKSAPVIMASQTTPNAFTHNTWLGNNGNYLFTTDEVNGSFVAAYDVTDITDIRETDRYQHAPGTGVIPHNVYVKDNFLVIAYYTAGVTIVDATYPHNLVEVAHYDTSPLSGGGFNGVWAVYPYLPSGNILATDRQEGLFVLSPTYQQACYLEGFVTNAQTGAPVSNAAVQILGLPTATAQTNFTGNYASGTAFTGAYQVVFSASGFFSDTLTVTLSANGQIAYLNAALEPLTFCTQPPLGVTVTAVTTNTAAVNWLTMPDALSYNLRYRKTGSATWVNVPNIVGNAYLITALVANTGYDVEVQANCALGAVSPFSGTVQFVTNGCLLPTGLTATNSSPTAVLLGWNAVLNAVGYTLQFRQSGIGALWTQQTTNLTNFQLTGLQPCTTYEWRVASVCAGNTQSNYTLIFTFTTTNPQVTLLPATTLACSAPVALNALLTGTGGGVWTGGAYILGNLFVSQGLTPGNYPVTYTVWGANCSVSQTELITVQPSPVAAFNPATIYICQGNFDLNALLTGTAGGVWTGGTYINGSLFLPDGLEPGLYTVTYSVGEGACFTSETKQLQVAHCPVAAQIILLLEGAFIPPSAMSTHLNTAGLLPNQQPFNQPPWNYYGTETLTQLPPDMVDWVLVELRNATNPALIMAQRAALLLQNGTIADVSGMAGAVFGNIAPGESAYIVVRHRNHLAVMSATPVSLPNNEPYNFTTATAQVFGNNQLKPVGNGFFALKAGDVNADGVITLADFNLFITQSALTGVYTPADLQLNASVTTADFNLLAPNISSIGIHYIRY